MPHPARASHRDRHELELQQGHRGAQVKTPKELRWTRKVSVHASLWEREKGGGCTRVNVELPCLLPPRNFMFIFLQKRIIIIKIVWVPGGKLLLPLVYGLGSEKIAQAMGNAGEGDVLQHIPFRPGTCPTAGCPASINWKYFIILLRVSSRKNSQHAVPSGARLATACKYSEEHNGSAGSGIKPFQRQQWCCDCSALLVNLAAKS